MVGERLSCHLSRYLLGQGREQEARAAIAMVNGYPPNDPFVDDIVEELEIGIRAENDVRTVRKRFTFS